MSARLAAAEPSRVSSGFDSRREALGTDDLGHHRLHKGVGKEQFRTVRSCAANRRWAT
jgi:hypothetical protein